MITRKIWQGDILWLAEGNSFWGDDVVRTKEGYAVAIHDSEAGEPLVDITGGYSVKRSDLRELSPREGRTAQLTCELGISEALNGISKTERLAMAEELRMLTSEPR